MSENENPSYRKSGGYASAPGPPSPLPKVPKGPAPGAKQKRTHTGTLYELERTDNTKNGNPRWRLHFLNRAYLTAPDTAVANTIVYEELVGTVVTLILNGHDQIVGIKKGASYSEAGRFGMPVSEFTTETGCRVRVFASPWVPERWLLHLSMASIGDHREAEVMLTREEREHLAAMLITTEEERDV